MVSVLGRVVGSLRWLCSLNDPFIGTGASKTPSVEAQADSFPPVALLFSEINSELGGCGSLNHN